MNGTTVICTTRIGRNNPYTLVEPSIASGREVQFLRGSGGYSRQEYDGSERREVPVNVKPGRAYAEVDKWLSHHSFKVSIAGSTPVLSTKVPVPVLITGCAV